MNFSKLLAATMIVPPQNPPDRGRRADGERPSSRSRPAGAHSVCEPRRAPGLRSPGALHRHTR